MLFIFLMVASNAWAGITYVQSREKNSGASDVTSDTLTFGNVTKSGNLIVVAVRRGGSSGTVTVTDSQGNTYNQAVNQASGTEHEDFIFYAMNITGGVTIVTTTFSVAQTMRVAIHEYSGIAGSNALDKTSSASGTSAAPDSGSQTTTVAQELVFGMDSSDNIRTHTAGTNFILRETNALKFATEDRIVSAIGSYSVSFSYGSSDNWAALMATFKGAEVLWLKLDDNSGTSATDSTGNGNTGTLTLGPNWTSTAKHGYAVDLDGNNDYISVANESNFDFERTHPFSIAMWIYRDTNTNEHDPLGKCDSSDNFKGYCMWLPASSDCNGCLEFDLNSGFGGDFIVFRTAAGVIPTTTWTHVAVTYSGSSTLAGLKVYINGRSVSASSSSDGLSSSILNNKNFVVGSEDDSVSTVFDGKIDDVRVYSRQLSAAEVRKIFQGGDAVRWSSD